MNIRKWLIVGGTVMLIMLALAVGLTQAQGPGPEENTSEVLEVEAAAPVSGVIPIQGRLTDNYDNPINGTRNITFSLYASSSTTTTLCRDEDPVDMDNGLFEAQIDGCSSSDIDGKRLYLGIQVEGDAEMTDRQPIYPVPYAWSLRPGAIISDTMSGNAILHIENWGATGRGLRVYAMEETGANFGIVGASRSPAGYGGYFYNNSAGGGTGLRAWSEASVGLEGYSYETADYPGVFGCSAAEANDCDPYRDNNAAGVMGYSEDDWGGYFVGNDSGGGGVYGTSTQGEGVLGVSNYGYGVQAGSGNNHALYAASVLSNGVYALSLGDGSIGVYGESSSTSAGLGVEGSSEAGSGVYGHSAEGFGVYGLTELTSNNYGFFTPDNLYSLNYNLMGAIMQVVQNSGEKTLEPGDVVAFSGIGASLEAGGPPTIQVIETSSANSTAVAGVVYSRFNIEAVTGDPKKLNLEVTPEGPVQPGEYMLVVVQGPAQVKASALAGSLQPGDLLSSAGQAGYAAKAAEVTLGGVKTAMPGTVLGKALEPLDEGQAMIYVFVTLQ